jgi:2Fe-2S ferredoxin
MEAAVQQGVTGIVAECGGACACATCHVIVDPAWMSVLAPPEGLEIDMVQFAVERTDTSRLSCQVRVTEAMDGLRLFLPREQA